MERIVYVKKPFAMSVEEAKEVFDLAKEKGVVVMANQNRRFDADMRTVRKVIETGVLGELLEIESHYDYYRPSIADRKGLGMLYGLQVHPNRSNRKENLEYQIKSYVTDRSYDNPGNSDDYSDIDLILWKDESNCKNKLLCQIRISKIYRSWKKRKLHHATIRTIKSAFEGKNQDQ